MATDANPQPEKYVSSVIKYSMKRNFNKKREDKGINSQSSNNSVLSHGDTTPRQGLQRWWSVITTSDKLR